MVRTWLNRWFGSASLSRQVYQALTFAAGLALAVIGLLIILTAAHPWLGITPGQALVVPAVALAMVIGSFVLLRAGALMPAQVLLILTTMGISSALVALFGGVGGPLDIILVTPCLIAGLMFGLHWGAAVSLIMGIFYIILTWLHLQGITFSLISPQTAILSHIRAVITALTFLFVGILVGRISHSLNRAVEGIRSHADNLSTLIEEVGASAEEVGVAMSDLARSAEMQAAQMEVITQSVEGLEQLSRRIAGAADETGQSAAETRQLFEQVVQKFGDLLERVRSIQHMAQMVDRFAEETHLLSLNATIEAARAGAAGRAFDVIAGEIRDLAQRSARSVAEIAELSTAIQAEMDILRRAVETTLPYVERTAEHAQAMIESTQQQQEHTAGIARAVGEAATAAQQVAASTEEASNATEEQVAALNQISHSAQSLVELIASLEQ
ncbi:MAG: methyl-accepting chemotaxis protein [Anaerolineae bacterium]